MTRYGHAVARSWKQEIFNWNAFSKLISSNKYEIFHVQGLPHLSTWRVSISGDKTPCITKSFMDSIRSSTGFSVSHSHQLNLSKMLSLGISSLGANPFGFIFNSLRPWPFSLHPQYLFFPSPLFFFASRFLRLDIFAFHNSAPNFLPSPCSSMLFQPARSSRLSYGCRR